MRHPAATALLPLPALAAIAVIAVLAGALIATPRAAGAQTGGFVGRIAFSPDGLASVVFPGGSVAALEAAASGVGAAGVWAQDAAGGFVLLVIGGPSFVNDGFRTRFPAGFAAPAAVTLTRAPGAAGATPPSAVAPPPPTPAPAPAPERAVGSWTSAGPPRGAVPATGEWIAIAAPEGKTIMARVLRPSGDGPFPAVVLLHSQTGFSNAYITLGEEFARAGFVTVVGCWFAGHYDGTTTADPPPPLPLADGIECPQGPVLRPIASTQPLADINALLAATRTLPGVRSDRVGLAGNSRGSIAAVLVGAAGGDALQAVVGIGGTPPGGPLFAAKITAPLLLIQGEADAVVPVMNSVMLEQALLALGRTVVSHYYPQAGHGILFDTPYHADAMARITSFLRAHLAK